MQMLENWQAAISSNLANASTPGFQKTVFQIATPVTETEEGGLTNESPLPIGAAQRAFSNGQIRVTAIGDASDKKELQRLLKVMASSYVNYVDDHFRQSLTAVWADPAKSAGKVTQEPTGWRVNWAFRR